MVMVYEKSESSVSFKETNNSLFEPLVGFEPTTPRLHITCSGQLSERGGWESYLHRLATTNYLCYVPVLEDSKGADRARLTRLEFSGCKGSKYFLSGKDCAEKNRDN